MNKRCFQVLGVREEASRDEIEEAYRKRVQIYHAADYADDPDYVASKLAELKTAYHDALGITSNDNKDDIPKLQRLNKFKDTVKEVEFAKKAESYSGEKNKDIKGKIAVTLIAMMIVFLSLLFNMCDSNEFDDSDDQYMTTYYVSLSDYGFGSEYDVEYTSTDDQIIHEEAMSVKADIVGLQSSDEYSYVTESDVDLQEIVNNYINSISGFPTLGDATDALYNRYDDFYYNSTDALTFQLEEYLSFYGFPSPDEVIGIINPYNGDVMETLDDYINYLQSYHDNFAEQ